MTLRLKIIISVIAVILALLHHFVPALKIDTFTGIVIVIAILPWILPYLKGFEIPGVLKIDLADAKAATDKVIQHNQGGDINIELSGVSGHGQVGQLAPIKGEPGNDSFSNLRKVYETDANLALVGFRIEVEKRIRQLARAHNLPSQTDSLHRLIRNLTDRGVITRDTGSGLMEVITLGNHAAHGAEVRSEVGEWLLNVGPAILRQLDALIPPKDSQASG